jgi:hypothetical protein
MRNQSLITKVNSIQHSVASAGLTRISENHWPLLRTNLVNLPIGEV